MLAALQTGTFLVRALVACMKCRRRRRLRIQNRGWHREWQWRLPSCGLCESMSPRRRQSVNVKRLVFAVWAIKAVACSRGVSICWQLHVNCWWSICVWLMSSRKWFHTNSIKAYNWSNRIFFRSFSSERLKDRGENVRLRLTWTADTNGHSRVEMALLPLCNGLRVGHHIPRYFQNYKYFHAEC